MMDLITDEQIHDSPSLKSKQKFQFSLKKTQLVN